MENNNETCKKSNLFTTIFGTFIACFIAVLLANLTTLFLAYKYIGSNIQVPSVAKIVNEVEESINKKHPIIATTLNFSEKYINTISEIAKGLDERFVKGLSIYTYVNKNELSINKSVEQKLMTKLMKEGKSALFDSDFDKMVDEQDFPLFVGKFLRSDESIGKEIGNTYLISLLNLTLPKLSYMYKSYLEARKCQIEKTRLTWALALYNHANKDNQLKENIIESLIKTGYWKATDNKECNYVFDNGVVSCKKHGNIEQPQNIYGTAQIAPLTENEKNEAMEFHLKFTKGACKYNQRNLMSGVEMYNMDHEIMMKNLNMETLFKDHYIKEIPNCPDKGVYSSVGDLSNDGKITCSVHGFIE